MELPRNHPAKKYYYAILASAPAELIMGNVITHFDGDMEMFLNEAIAKMSATDDGFDFEELGFGERPVACFIVMSQTEKSNNALGMLYLEQAYQVNEKRCTLETPSRTYRDVHFIIQEAGNLGVAIQNLTNKWTSGLGQGFFFHLVLQDLEQLTSLYSESIKITIVGNTGNLVYIRSGSLDTNKYVSERLGKRTNYSKDRSRQDPFSLKVSERETSERIDLLSPSELERLRKSETIVLRLSHVDDLDGELIYQYPIYNSIETDKNMVPFYEYRNNHVLSWDDILVCFLMRVDLKNIPA
ncbi:type IV secretory system conjugative DNA transfer family protein [Enterococcus sp. 4E1_DIV0656]|uniref:type IV secretory system conjugative DNA transfer family protein n=1 Tax=unclassified Enterococcus TaxID=2608891 RepID=UPI0020CC895F|nr:TraG/TraD/VirD4 family protein [Enterococcus sp. 4E1_DIV0656]